MSSRGAEMIAAERERHQAEEGYTKSSDVRYNGSGQLSSAAAVYALTEDQRQSHSITKIVSVAGEERPVLVPFPWPWLPEFYKPTPDDRVRELVKAGALIAAAIDVELAKR